MPRTKQNHPKNLKGGPPSRSLTGVTHARTQQRSPGAVSSCLPRPIDAQQGPHTLQIVSQLIDLIRFFFCCCSYHSFMLVYKRMLNLINNKCFFFFFHTPQQLRSIFSRGFLAIVKSLKGHCVARDM